MTQPKVIICPYCGETQPAGERCRSCGGLFEPLSRQATHNAMGPWFLRDPGKPFQPGFCYETLVRMIDRVQLTKYSIVRGPTTRQFWTVAKHVPGVAHLLGYCHNCDASVDPGDHGCHVCGQSFGAYLDRNYLGLPDVRPMPWEVELEGGEMPLPGMSGMPSSQGGGLSRFASDEELLGHGPVDGGGGGGGGAGGTATKLAMQTETRTATMQDPAPDTVEDYRTSSMARSLRRKLAGQQRLINALAVTVILVTILSVLTNLDELGAMVGVGDRVKPVPAAPPGTPLVAPAVAAPGAPSPGTNGETAVEPAAVKPVPAAAPDPLDPPEPPEPPDPPDPVAEAWQETITLITSAQKADRSLDERIKDYEQAVEKLRAMAGSVPAERQPVGLSETITRTERELERLRLERDFYG